MAEEKKETAKKENEVKLSDDQIDAALRRVLGDKDIPASSMEEILSANAKALAEIARQSIPHDTQSILKKMDDAHESPYIEIEGKIGVLTVSTIDLATIDGWPGYVDEAIPGEYTAQHLQKRLRIPIEVNYEPSLERRYDFDVVDKEEYMKTKGQLAGGSIPNASMIASMALRAGDNR